jgi:hypothetical protein
LFGFEITITLNIAVADREIPFVFTIMADLIGLLAGFSVFVIFTGLWLVVVIGDGIGVKN